MTGENATPRVTLAMDLDRVEALSADLERIAEASSDAGPLLREMVAHCQARVPHYDWVGVYLLQDGELQLGPYAGPQPAQPRLPLGQGVAGAAAQSGQAVLANQHTEAWAGAGGAASPAAAASELAVPIRDGKRVLGVLAILSARSGALNEHDQALAERAASFLAGAIARAPHPPHWPKPELVK